MKLENKVIVVTGATRGIGRSIAEACGRQGGKIVICSRHEAAVNEIIDNLKNTGISITGITADVSRYADLEKLLHHAIDTWGKVDVWINNAGLSSGMRAIYELNENEIKEVIDVNLTGTLMSCKLVLPYFIRQNGGIIINMGGRGGQGDASPFLTTYAATKAAVVSLTKSLAKEYKSYPISIHSVIPGMVATDFYRDIKIGANQEDNLASIPFVLKAFGVPLDEVGDFFVQISAQKPGKVTGKTYFLLKGGRLLRGIGLIIYYRTTGKVKARM
jgi:NAD(P)-dependent dehydrogenase (short-subunit alcohol dehydrogenase family)